MSIVSVFVPVCVCGGGGSILARVCFDYILVLCFVKGYYVLQSGKQLINACIIVIIIKKMMCFSDVAGGCQSGLTQIRPDYSHHG